MPSISGWGPWTPYPTDEARNLSLIRLPSSTKYGSGLNLPRLLSIRVGGLAVITSEGWCAGMSNERRFLSCVVVCGGVVLLFANATAFGRTFSLVLGTVFKLSALHLRQHPCGPSWFLIRMSWATSVGPEPLLRAVMGRYVCHCLQRVFVYKSSQSFSQNIQFRKSFGKRKLTSARIQINMNPSVIQQPARPNSEHPRPVTFKSRFRRIIRNFELDEEGDYWKGVPD